MASGLLLFSSLLCIILNITFLGWEGGDDRVKNVTLYQWGTINPKLKIIEYGPKKKRRKHSLVVASILLFNLIYVCLLYYLFYQKSPAVLSYLVYLSII